MSQGPLSPNLTKKFQKEVSQISNHNFPLVILLCGLSVNLIIGHHWLLLKDACGLEDAYLTM